MLSAECAELTTTVKQLGRDFAALYHALQATIVTSPHAIARSQRRRRRRPLASDTSPPGKRHCQPR
jgi:hypothetical protein